MASANDIVDEKIEIAAESDFKSSDKAHESSVSGSETTLKKIKGLLRFLSRMVNGRWLVVAW